MKKFFLSEKPACDIILLSIKMENFYKCYL